MTPPAHASEPPADWRVRFPALAEEMNGRPIAYLDSAATTHRPDPVIEAVAEFYRRDNANPAPALHGPARRAHGLLEDARATVARFIGAGDPQEIVFTRGTTEGLNLIAWAWAGEHLRPGDEIVLTVAEHASNHVPWQLAARRTGAALRFADVDGDGRLAPEAVGALIGPRTRLVALSHVSNVLGIVNPVREVSALARAAGARVVVDGAQAAPHLPLDVRSLGCDFFAFSAHKMLGPMGTGVLWVAADALEELPPFHGGSNMAHEVDLESAVFERGARRFGAGTPDVAGPVGLAAAIRFLEGAGRERVRLHEAALAAHASARLREVPGLRVLGAAGGERVPVFSFAMDGIPASAVVRELDAEGIAVRGGDLASLPLLRRFGLREAARASFYLYSTSGEVDRLADALMALRERHPRAA
ncbi:MAG TPA: cysteine desulfurase [Gemmatimonadota bacterium]|jgi:cysteine desulfurase/selenocysteine lyase